MSGAEVAGLVLGAFPLLIAALDGSRKGYQGLRDWWKIRRNYTKCLNDVKAEYTIFLMNLTELLQTITHDDGEQKRLLDDPYGAEWASGDLEDRIRDRMPTAHMSYLATMDAMNAALVALGRELGIDKIGFQNRVRETAAGNVGAPRRSCFVLLTSTRSYISRISRRVRH